MKKEKVSKSVRTPIQKIMDKISPIDFKYSGINYTFDTDYPCQQGDNCCDNDYCRCGIIINTKVLSVDVDMIRKNLCHRVSPGTIIEYCLDRLIRQYFSNPVSWEVIAARGYYGEEVEGLSNNNINKFTAALSKLNDANDSEKIKIVLEEEYGHLLSKLTKLHSVEIKDVSMDSIVLPNENYNKKISKETIDLYKEYSLPIAVCVKSGRKFSVIDGYHRTISAIKNKKETVSIIDLSK